MPISTSPGLSARLNRDHVQHQPRHGLTKGDLITIEAETSTASRVFHGEVERVDPAVPHRSSAQRRAAVPDLKQIAHIVATGGPGWIDRPHALLDLLKVRHTSPCCGPCRPNASPIAGKQGSRSVSGVCLSGTEACIASSILPAAWLTPFVRWPAAQFLKRVPRTRDRLSRPPSRSTCWGVTTTSIADRIEHRPPHRFDPSTQSGDRGEGDGPGCRQPLPVHRF